MTVYASTPGFAESRRHPTALTAIVAVHALAIAAVMSAKMDLPTKIERTITEIEFLDPPKPPPPLPPEPQPQPKQQPQQSVIDHTPRIVEIPILDVPPVDSRDVPIPPLDIPIGPTIEPVPQPDTRPAPEPVRVGPRFATPAEEVRPPYPSDKRRAEEEAALRLRLSIDPRGSRRRAGRRSRSLLPPGGSPPHPCQLALQTGDRGRAGGRLVDGDHAAVPAGGLGATACVASVD